MADGFQITPELIETIQKSKGVQEFSIPQGGKALVAADGEVHTYYPKTKLQEREEERALAKPSVVALSTLAGLAEYAEKVVGLDDKIDNLNSFVIKVIGPSEVQLWDYQDETCPRHYVNCKPAGLPGISVLFEFVGLDDGLIQMQECFEQDSEVNKVVEVLSTVKIEDLVELTDNGVSREITVRARVTGGKDGDANVQGLVLKPLRTFPELDIKPSQFSFRWIRKGNTVVVRLVERQHHLWRYNQCQAIAEFLKALLPEARILV